MIASLFWLVGACATPKPEPILVPLDGPRLVRRMSLDLRGVLPTAGEMEAAADPVGEELAVDRLRDLYLEDPRLEDRLVSMLAERWWTRVDVFDIVYQDYQLDPLDEFAFERSVGEEPLRLMAHVAVNDLPWTEIVTADYTLSNDTLEAIWPLQADEPGAQTRSGWRTARYTDGRPAAGVLATNGLWWRYITNLSNMNRSRAAAISRLLLCEDVLARPISFSATESDLSDLETEISTNPACVSCHSALDPVAASLFGFWWLSLYSEVEETRYHPEREPLWRDWLGVEPAWYGQPINGLADLGWSVASDARFYQCAVESTAELLWRRPRTTDELPLLEDLREDFLEQDLRMKALLRGITDTDAYRAGGLTDAATDADAERERTVRLLSPDQLASAVEDLTGFRWTWEGFDQMANDDIGYRILAGGVDGYAVGSAQTEPGLTWHLVVKRLAQAAAAHGVERDLALPVDERTLLTMDDPSHDPTTLAWQEQVEALHWRLYAEPAAPEWVEAIGALWLAVAIEEDYPAAWTATISAMLRDPRFVMY